MVKIEIDTQKDSKEEIRRIIKYLKEHVEGHSSTPPSTSVFTDSPDRSSNQESSSTAEAFNLFDTGMNQTDVEKKKEPDDDDISEFEIKPIFY